MRNDATAELSDSVRVVSDTVRTTLGPFGATKLLVGTDGTVTTTTSGATVLDQLDISDPAVTVLRTAVKDFGDRHGDGTTRLVTLTGTLLQEAVDLVDDGVHPTTVAKGYREALAVARAELDRRARPLSVVGPAAVARSALTATRDPGSRQTVGEYLERLVDVLGTDFDADRVNVIARIGARAETELVRGVVLNKAAVTEGMPRRADGAGVALLSSTVDVPKLGGLSERSSPTVSLATASFEDRVALGEAEQEGFEAQLTAAVDAGCRFVATSRAVNERVERTLANYGVLAIERVDDDDLIRLATATGARVVPDLGQITAETLGRADVAIRRKAGRDMLVVESDVDESFTLFCRAPDPRSVTSFERSVEEALAAVERANQEGTIVPGGGAVEVALARAVRERARSVSDREQLAMAAFADALLSVPRTHAENAGLDGWTGLIRLLVAHDEGRDATGVDALAGDVGDVLGESPIADPTALVRDVLTSSTELASRLVRIDDRLPAATTDEETTEPQPAE